MHVKNIIVVLVGRDKLFNYCICKCIELLNRRRDHFLNTLWPRGHALSDFAAHEIVFKSVVPQLSIVFLLVPVGGVLRSLATLIVTAVVIT
eukprot:XP_001704076.1 Hypothetical protein GL50803_38130 [Giardia lamblia ATCC 50803]